ncbi:helix-turn-helix domain-containing protein [Falsihalocynthiibacter sp. SS001]|uniref:helix-turn-helix domain-containing protein n=1 Tax=Falsihalocynthiibacter sp. SS001 TaxID=3349698 RepID=UPI0036D27792
MTNIFPKNLMTPDEVATYLSVSVETLNVWRCTKRYDLPYVKAGRLVRYRIEDVNAFVASRLQGVSND